MYRFRMAHSGMEARYLAHLPNILVPLGIEGDASFILREVDTILKRQGIFPAERVGGGILESALEGVYVIVDYLPMREVLTIDGEPLRESPYLHLEAIPASEWYMHREIIEGVLQWSTRTGQDISGFRGLGNLVTGLLA